MKKYHIADVLTAIEVILAVTLLGMAFTGTPANVAIWVFSAGELCDAFDGMCARRWHYPDDGKRRWWRVYAPELDQLSDIALIVAAALYLVVGLGITSLLFFGFGVGIYCTTIEILTHGKEKPRYYRKAILFRRYVYLACIAIAVITMIFATTWPMPVKKALLALAILIGIILIIVKWNRLT